jgi:hypothetical protein
MSIYLFLFKLIMKILNSIVLSLLLSYVSASGHRCSDYISYFDGCSCDSDETDIQLYGKKSFLVTCGSLPDVMTINPMDHYSAQELILNDNVAVSKRLQIMKSHLNKENEFIEIKSRCVRGSIQTQVENGSFNLNKKEITQVITKILEIAQIFLNQNIIITNINPAQICLGGNNYPTLFDVRGLKVINEKQKVDSLAQFLPPEYFQSYIEDSTFVYGEKFISYQIGYLFYFMMKKKHPFILRDSPDENIWTKRIEFDQIDRSNFVSFIKRTLVGHHIRLTFAEIINTFKKQTNGTFFNFGISSMNRDEYYILEENVLHQMEEESSKTSVPMVIFILFSFFGLLLAGTFLFCKDTFYIFMPKEDLEVAISSENSGECSYDDVENAKPTKEDK